MKRIKPADAGYKTTNAILAYCLHLAGVPWLDDRHPVMVLYSAAILRGFTNTEGKPIYQGWEFEKAVVDAHKKGRRGHVQYKFQQTPRLKRLLKEYTAQSARLESETGYVHEIVHDLIAQFPELEPDVAMMRLACIMLKSRLAFMELWTHQVPCMLIPNEGEVERIDEGVQNVNGELRRVIREEHPGFKIMSTNASKSTREHLGLA